ncbi:hypothetical protein FB645_002956 [Coemansia sp. IMI 203386]|nr:hypothetical protein FB645_002956 [Coemansia sp. IMI 203386]
MRQTTVQKLGIAAGLLNYFCSGYAVASEPSSPLSKRVLGRRAAGLNETQKVTDSASVWRAYACMVPFTDSAKTPLMAVYGGTDDDKATDPLNVAVTGSNRLLVFDLDGNAWYAPATKGQPDVGPVLPGCGASSDSVWAYDTHYGTPGKDSLAVSLLDAANWSWSAPTEKGQLPVTRFGAAFEYVPDKKLFYMHGGIPLNSESNVADNPPGIANNMDILTPSTVAWMYASNGPARKYHSLCHIDSIHSLVLFGGSDQNIASYNDIKVFSVDTNIWQYAVTIDGDIPAERILHSAVCSGDKMYVFGGLHSIDDNPSDSAVWVLTANNATSFTWSKAPVVTESGGSTGPTARAGHAAALHNNAMYVFGGIGPSGKDSVMYKLDLEKWAWSTIQVNESQSGDSKGGSNTKVLIAAVVSSVLGVICIGIAAFVFYRWNRRRNPLSASPDSASAINNADKPDYSPNDVSGTNDGSPSHMNESSLYDSGSNTKNASFAAAAAAAGLVASMSNANPKDTKDYSREYEQAGYIFMGGTGSTAVQNHGKNVDIVTNNYLPLPHSNPSLGSSIMEPSPSMGSVANMSPAAGNSNRNSNANSFVNIANNRSPGTSQTPASTHDTRPQSSSSFTMPETFTHADVISDILASGQPIPAWLREAARQASAVEGSANDQVAKPGEDQARSMYSDTTNDTQSARILDPIRYVDVSRVSTQRTNSMLRNADENAAAKTPRRRRSELSDLTFDYDTRQRLGFGVSPVPAIAEPMSPPVPLRMNSLYGELESRGIVVGQADDMQLARVANRVQHHRAEADDGILSPLDRLARYHNLVDSQADELSASNQETRTPSLLESEGGGSVDTSRIYPAQPVRRESSDDFLNR